MVRWTPCGTNSLACALVLDQVDHTGPAAAAPRRHERHKALDKEFSRADDEEDDVASAQAIGRAQKGIRVAFRPVGADHDGATGRHLAGAGTLASSGRMQCRVSGARVQQPAVLVCLER